MVSSDPRWNFLPALDETTNESKVAAALWKPYGGNSAAMCPDTPAARLHFSKAQRKLLPAPQCRAEHHTSHSETSWKHCSRVKTKDSHEVISTPPCCSFQQILRCCLVAVKTAHTEASSPERWMEAVTLWMVNCSRW